MKRLMLAGVFAVPALMLGIVAATIAMIFSLQSEVGVLAKRARNSAHAEKALRAEIAAVKDELAALEAPPAATPVAESAAVPAAPRYPAPPVASAVVARVVLASAQLPPECSFRPGGSAGLVECIMQQQDRIRQLAAQSLYR